MAELESHQLSDVHVGQIADQEVLIEQETPVVPESVTSQNKSESLEATNQHPDSTTQSKLQGEEAPATDLKLEQEQEAHSVDENCTEKKDSSECTNLDDGHDQTSPSKGNDAESKKVHEDSVDDGDHVGEINAASQKAFGPPANPPPPPNALQDSPGDGTRSVLT